MTERLTDAELDGKLCPLCKLLDCEVTLAFAELRELREQNTKLVAALGAILATVNQPAPEHRDTWHVAVGQAINFRNAVMNARTALASVKEEQE